MAIVFGRAYGRPGLCCMSNDRFAHEYEDRTRHYKNRHLRPFVVTIAELHTAPPGTTSANKSLVLFDDRNSSDTMTICISAVVSRRFGNPVEM